MAPTEPDDDRIVVAWAPGRVNLIGEHTDHTGGLVLPLAIDRWTVVRGRRSGGLVSLRSHGFTGTAIVDRAGLRQDAGADASWARFVGAVTAEVAPEVGFTGGARTTVPVGGGLSSSASFSVALALALGADPDDHAPLAALARRAEHRATGTPTGVMDQIVVVSAAAGAALAIDCRTLVHRAVPLPSPDELVILVADSGLRHELASSEYGERVRACAAAEAEIGPLRDATPAEVAAMRDPVLRARARHVVTENLRVLAVIEALASGDHPEVGRLLVEGHRSLRDDFSVSVPEVDGLVDALCEVPGVLGARLTGGGFGGNVVAVARPGALAAAHARGLTQARAVRAVAGAGVRAR